MLKTSEKLRAALSPARVLERLRALPSATVTYVRRLPSATATYFRTLPSRFGAWARRSLRPRRVRITNPYRGRAGIAWGVVTVFVLAGVVVSALGVTSTRWFCSEGCHKVQDDTIAAYARSTHSEISCMSCHMPVGAGPVTFVLHKAEALGELYLTVTNRFHLPLNPGSALALEEHKMPSAQCTQCHTVNRAITPAAGILIDHEVHETNEVHCTVCHNRIAHREDGLELTLAGNVPHDDFMSMQACFRCHVLEGSESEPKPLLGAVLPAAATTVPSATATDSATATESATATDSATATATQPATAPPAASVPPTPAAEPPFSPKPAPGDCALCHTPAFELKPANHRALGFFEAGMPSKGHGEASKADPGYCTMCHVRETFCDSCHGLEMPHPTDFQQGHGNLGTERPEVCSTCHSMGVEGGDFCNACHHRGSDPSVPWLNQHMLPVRSQGANVCMGCHNPTYCAKCHVRVIR